MSVTNVQQARAIIKAVGEEHQYYVSDMLRSLTYYTLELKCKREAQKVIEFMEKEYVLNVANVLWANKFDQIPDYIKNYT